MKQLALKNRVTLSCARRRVSKFYIELASLHNITFGALRYPRVDAF